ncbi:hypothetical protein D3C81_10720 [compost metagenome]
MFGMNKKKQVDIEPVQYSNKPDFMKTAEELEQERLARENKGKRTKKEKIVKEKVKKVKEDKKVIQPQQKAEPLPFPIEDEEYKKPLSKLEIALASEGLSKDTANNVQSKKTKNTKAPKIPKEKKVKEKKIKSVGNKRGKLKFILIPLGVIFFIVTIGLIVAIKQANKQVPKTPEPSPIVEDTKPSIDDNDIEDEGNENDTTVIKDGKVEDDKNSGDTDITIKNNTKDNSETKVVTNNKSEETFVEYTNKLLGVTLKYPDSWFYEDKSDIILNMVKAANVSKFDIKTSNVNGSNIVANFYAGDKLKNNIDMLVQSNSVATDGTSANIGSYSCKVQEENSNNENIIKVTVFLGNNNLVFIGKSKVGENKVDKYAIMEEMIDGLNLN